MCRTASRSTSVTGFQVPSLLLRVRAVHLARVLQRRNAPDMVATSCVATSPVTVPTANLRVYITTDLFTKFFYRQMADWTLSVETMVSELLVRVAPPSQVGWRRLGGSHALCRVRWARVWLRCVLTESRTVPRLSHLRHSLCVCGCATPSAASAASRCPRSGTSSVRTEYGGRCSS